MLTPIEESDSRLTRGEAGGSCRAEAEILLFGREPSAGTDPSLPSASFDPDLCLVGASVVTGLRSLFTKGGRSVYPDPSPPGPSLGILGRCGTPLWWIDTGFCQASMSFHGPTLEVRQWGPQPFFPIPVSRGTSLNRMHGLFYNSPLK